MSKLYKVRLLAHAGASRRRAGLEFEKGQARTLELTNEQLEALKADSFFSVKVAGEGEAGEVTSTTSTPEAPNLYAKKRKQLDKMAVKLGLDPKEYKNIETLVPAIEAAQVAADEKAKAEEAAKTSTPENGDVTPPAGDEGSDDDETEEDDVVLTELSVDDLKVIATELEINTAEFNSESEDENKAKLIEAIEAKKAQEE